MDPIEWLPKDSGLNSLNQSEEPMSAKFDKKIELSASANKLSSRRYQSVTKDGYLSEETDSKISDWSPQSAEKDTPNPKSSEGKHGVHKYLLNMSSNQSLKINNSELELISSKDFKKEEDQIKLELKYSEASSSSKQTPKNMSEEILFEKDTSHIKELFKSQTTTKTGKFSKLIEQEKMRRQNAAKEKNKKSNNAVKKMTKRAENLGTKATHHRTRQESKGNDFPF